MDGPLSSVSFHLDTQEVLNAPKPTKLEVLLKLGNDIVNGCLGLGHQSHVVHKDRHNNAHSILLVDLLDCVMSSLWVAL